MWKTVRALVVAVLALPGDSAQAQRVEIRVVEEITRRPLAGVVVHLVRDGRTVTMGLSNESGNLVLQAPGAGPYELQASRIGHEAARPIPLQLLAGIVRQVIEMPQAVRMLPAITVSGVTRCERSPQQGSLAAALWQEVQTALNANRITAEQGLQVLHTVRFHRDRSPTNAVLRERITGSGITQAQPFVALSAGDLSRRGFVYEANDMVHYAAPDAALLLADEFVNGHCFRVDQKAAAAGLIGLAFEPVGPTRLSDVRGTLWIDRESRELRHLEYRYTGLEGPQALGDPGGEIRFQRLDSGAWIVSEWFIRMPVAGEVPDPAVGADRYVLLGWVEQGGRASVPAREPSGFRQRSMVEGVVFDSLHSRGLAGAVVSIDGEIDSARTDDQGGFRLSVAGQGPRLLRVTHPLLGMVRDNSTQEIVLSPQQPAMVRLAVPSPAAFARTFCAGEETGAAVLGLVYDSTGAPAAGRTVQAVWSRALSVGARRGAANTTLSVESGPRGEFAFCNLPGQRRIRLELLGDHGRALHQVEIVADAGFQWVDLRAREE